jgi:nucleoside diphosphate kinase
MSSGDVQALLLSAPGAIQKYRSLLTEAQAGKKILRQIYGTETQRNALHGSDSLQSAKREIRFFFGDLVGMLYMSCLSLI